MIRLALLALLATNTTLAAQICGDLPQGAPAEFCAIPQSGFGAQVKIQTTNAAMIFEHPANAAEDAWNREANAVLAYEFKMNDEGWSLAKAEIGLYGSTLLSGVANKAYGAPGANAKTSLRAFNFLVPSGREAMINDLLKPDALEPLAAKCMAQAKDQIIFKEHERELLKGRILAPSSWSFTAKGAAILLPPFSLGGAVQPLYSCSFTPVDLKPYLQPSLGLWQ